MIPTVPMAQSVFDVLSGFAEFQIQIKEVVTLDDCIVIRTLGPQKVNVAIESDGDIFFYFFDGFGNCVNSFRISEKITLREVLDKASLFLTYKL